MHHGESMEMNERRKRTTLQPIARFKASSSVSGLCFLSHQWPATSSTTSKKQVGNAKDDDEEISPGTTNCSVGHDDDADNAESSSSSDDEELSFQCRSMMRQHINNGGMGGGALFQQDFGGISSCMDDATTTAVFLATCHNQSPALVWDLRHEKVVYEFGNHDRTAGPGLTLRRLQQSDELSSPSLYGSRVLYQTRNPEGTVSLHDLSVGSNGSDNHAPPSRGGGGATAAAPVMTIETYSRTFCAASPCVGDVNLVALPSHHASYATIRDWRISPKHRPVAYLHGAACSTWMMANHDDEEDAVDRGGGFGDTKKKHGMLTSLAMLCGPSSSAAVLLPSEADLFHTTTTSACSSSSRPILACGMEDGSIFFHDLAMTGRGKNNSKSGSNSIPHCLSSSSPQMVDNANTLSNNMISLSSSTTSTSDPVLTLDLALSADMTAKHDHDDNNYISLSFVAVAGVAGHAADLGDVSPEEQGRVAIIKGSSSSAPNHDEKRKLSLRLRARVGPNYYQNTSDVDCLVSSRNMPTTTTTSASTTTPSATGPGFAGISVCRWRPDGRIFAAGGWDKRVRIYDRAIQQAAPEADVANGRIDSSSTNYTPVRMLAVLKGHEASVTAVDWAPDAKRSGILATGATDGSVYIWSCFGSHNNK